jgi:formimidoylglutamase
MNLPSEVEELLMPATLGGRGLRDDYAPNFWECVRPWQELERIDVGLIGVPFDTPSIIRRGSMGAPPVIRQFLGTNRNYEPSLGLTIPREVHLTDFGDVRVVHTEPDETNCCIEKVLTAICALGTIPVVLGGDHSISYPAIRGLCNATNGRVGVIMFDAHTDVRISHYGEITSGAPFRRVLEEIPGQPVQPGNLVEIGINGWHNSRFYLDYLAQKGARVFTAWEVHCRGIEEIMAEALTLATEGTQAVYASVDIDAVDAAFAPGTGAPTPGGLTSYQILQAAYLLGQHPLVRGLDVVEVAPPYDINDITSILAAAIIQSFLAAAIARRG